MLRIPAATAGYHRQHGRHSAPARLAHVSESHGGGHPSRAASDGSGSGSGSGLDGLATEVPNAAARCEIFTVCDETSTRPMHRAARPHRPLPQAQLPAAAPSPVPAAPDARLVETLRDAERQLQQHATKPIDTAEIASLVNTLRRYGPSARIHHRPQGLDDLMAHITPEHVDRFYRAMGITEDDRKRMDELAFRSGLLNPSGSLLSNLLNFGLAPVIGSATGSTWAGTGFSIAMAYVFSALALAAQQTAVVAVCEHIREHGHTVVIDKTAIHDGNWINDLPPRVGEAMEAYAVAHDRLEAFLKQIATRLGIVPAEAGHPQGTALTDGEMRTVLARMSDAERQEFEALAGPFAEREEALQGLLVDMLRAEGVVERHRVGNFWQIVPRCARAPLSSLCAMFRGVPKGEVPPPGKHVEILGSWATTGLQVGLVPTMHLAQMLAAGCDEHAKQHYHHRLNLLFADVFNAAGLERVRRGEQVTAADIDPDKVRRLVIGPATAMVERMTAVVKHTKAQADERIATLDAKALARAAAASGTMSAADRLEHADVDRQFTRLERREREELVLFAGDLARDQAALAEGRLVDIVHRTDSFVGALLTDKTKHYFGSLLVRDIGSRFAKPGEFTSQFIQRVSSMFIMGVCGTAVSSTIGKIVISIKGGSSQVSRGLIGGLAGLALFFSAVGAATQYILLAIKNHRRMHPEQVSAARQLGMGVLAPYQIVQARRHVKPTIAQANALLDDHPLHQQIARVTAPQTAAPEADDIIMTRL